MSFISNLFGGNKAPQINFTPAGITNPTGFSVSGGGNVTESPTLQGNIGNLQSTFQQQAGAFGGLAQTVQPGFSQFRQAGLRDISNQFRSARSNLQDTLAQRRILGSSFANSAFSQEAADEAQTKANFEAQSYLNELQASYNLIQAQYTAQTNSYTSAINQSNIEAGVAASLTASNNNTAAQIATANAKLQADAQAGAGNFFGTLLGTVGNAFGGKGLFSAGGIFGGSAAASGFGAGGSIAADAGAFNAGTTDFLASLADAAPLLLGA